MIIMMEFLKTLCSTAALVSVALLFLPEEKGIRNAAFTAFSLILLLLLLPKDGSFSLSSLITLDEGAPLPESGVYGETVETAVAEGIKRDLVSRFSLNADAVTLVSDLTLTDTAISGSYLSLSLGKENFFADVTALIRYVKNTYGVDCEVHFIGN